MSADQNIAGIGLSFRRAGKSPQPNTPCSRAR